MDLSLIPHHEQVPRPGHLISILGSPRPNGNTDKIQALLEQELEGKLEKITKVQLRDLTFRSCIGCEGCRRMKKCVLQDGLTPIYPEIIESEFMVMITPCHHYTVTAWMKAFIDRMYCFYEFSATERPRKWASRMHGQDRKAVLVAVCEQPDEDLDLTFRIMRLSVEGLGYRVIAQVPVVGLFDKGAITQSESAQAPIREAARRIIEEYQAH